MTNNTSAIITPLLSFISSLILIYVTVGINSKIENDKSLLNEVKEIRIMLNESLLELGKIKVQQQVTDKRCLKNEDRINYLTLNK